MNNYEFLNFINLNYQSLYDNFEEKFIIKIYEKCNKNIKNTLRILQNIFYNE